MNRVYVLSHTDLDGFLSAGLVEFYWKTIVSNKDDEFKHKSWTYGRNLPSIDYIKKNYDYVFVVDLCPDTAFMMSLYEHYKDNFIWIDHHSKPDKEFYDIFKEKYPDKDIKGLRIEQEHSDSAASLVYKFYELDRDVEDFKKNIPSWLKACSDFDCWNKYDEIAWNSIVMPIFSCLKQIISSPSDAYNYIKSRYDSGNYYDNIYDASTGNYCNVQTESELERGKILYEGLLSIYKEEVKHGFERTLSVEMGGKYEHLKAWICNTQNRSSVIFEQMDNLEDYDVFIPYHFNGEKYFYSMYTFKPEISCNDITVFSSDDWHQSEPLLTFRGHKDAAGANSEIFAFSKS